VHPGKGTAQPSKLNILDLEESIIQIHRRLARVTIENLPCGDVIQRYVRPQTFFYLDPPYYGIKAYRLNFEPKDFEVLAQTLAKMKGRFLMSLNDHKEVRHIFGGFKIQRSRCATAACASPAATVPRAERSRSVTTNRDQILWKMYTFHLFLG